MSTTEQLLELWLYPMERHPRSALRGIAAEHLACRLQWVSGRPPRLQHASQSMSISRARGLSAVAIGHNCRVGVDLEAVRPRADVEAVAEFTMSPAEWRRWKCVPDAARDLFFHGTWTCKEAVLKALGLGLADLEDVDSELPTHLPLGAWVPVPLVRLPARSAEPQDVSLFVANLGAHVASVAVIPRNPWPTPLLPLGTTSDPAGVRHVTFRAERNARCVGL